MMPFFPGWIFPNTVRSLVATTSGPTVQSFLYRKIKGNAFVLFYV